MDMNDKTIARDLNKSLMGAFSAVAQIPHGLLDAFIAHLIIDTNEPIELLNNARIMEEMDGETA